MVYRDRAKYLAWRKKFNLSKRVKKIKLKCVVCSATYETTEGFKNKSMFCSRKCKSKHFFSSDKGKKLKAQYAIRHYYKNSKSINEKKRLRFATDENYRLKKKEINQKYRKTPKGQAMKRATNKKGKAHIKQATPRWNDNKKTTEIYRIAVKMEKLLNKHLAKHNQPPIKYNVDHVIPLRGKTFEEGAPVSGLNVWYNLMPILQDDNVSKQDLCPPMTSINNQTPQLTLDKLPLPKAWMRFIRVMYTNALKASKDNRHYEKIIKNYIEVNPRNLKNN